jgi:prepilin-type N-terminal cleavage/methylation domain-containing protein
MYRRRRNSRRNQRGFSVIEMIIVFVVLGLLIAVGWRVFNRLRTEKPPVSANSTKVVWNFDGTQWQPSEKPPQCEDPLLPVSPVDTSLATSVLYPGQYRGFDYKAHGGFRFDNSKSNDITVRLPMDGQLTGLMHYIEQGDVQYVVTFTNACGITYRFDHLYTLSSKLKTIADTLPEPKQDDTRSLPIENGPKFAAGEVVATAVGSPRNNNIGMDFGVYDLRKANEISKNVQWASLHADKREQAYYGVCWFDLLPVVDMNKVKELIGKDNPVRTVSDYCPMPGGNTLQYNDGRPTQG